MKTYKVKVSHTGPDAQGVIRTINSFMVILQPAETPEEACKKVYEGLRTYILKEDE